ncbi:histidine kinase [Spirosoma taeanense]|uniref:Histidine kinase n=1 Tax=Spirosoma taeanense TaxID=2735870 RepID=A0A6M5Y732_9BACT|nr:sensor histidine kinase [Spirosoma taeanense]QJW89150.1 histidine kinase [Spirosoma taeanense]
MKEWFTLDRYDVFVMVVSYPAVFLANYLILESSYFRDITVFVPVTLGSTVLYVLFAWGDDAWMKYMRYRYREHNQLIQRLVYCLVAYVALMVVLVCSIFWLYDLLRIPGYQFDADKFRLVLFIGFICNIVSVGISEAIYSYRKWQESVAREYELKQLHMQQQLDVLKQQVNPHFLFNSLNSLISLIGENPQQAEVYAEELSSVYRYVLRANEQNLTDLDTELDFIRSYYHLLKTRHGNGLDLVVSVEERFGRYQLPPLTLQLLVENAVKHNIVLPDQPLRIKIGTDGQAHLSVCNSLQKKSVRVLSNGVGLTNIMAKYQMLGYPVPTIREADGQFVVTLPLIAGTK